LIGALLHKFAGSACAEQPELRARVAELEARDSVSGLLSARAFYEQLASAFHAPDERRRPGVALIVLEIDCFAELAAQYGCESAEELLRPIGAVLGPRARRHEPCGRLGLSRFALALPGTVKPEALAVACRIQDAIARSEFRLVRDCVRVTASIGVAAVPDDAADIDALFAHARAALREAQSAGGNRAWPAGSRRAPENRRV